MEKRLATEKMRYSDERLLKEDIADKREEIDKFRRNLEMLDASPPVDLGAPPQVEPASDDQPVMLNSEVAQRSEPAPKPVDEPFYLNITREKDGWTPAIRDAAELVYNELERMPNATQVWVCLYGSPPKGYRIKPDGGMLTMPSENPLSRKDFEVRWAKYTRKQT
jgi:hypothetical protein